jgi:hypothetical protein
MLSHHQKLTNSINNSINNSISKSNQEIRRNVTFNSSFSNRPKQLRPILATRDTPTNPEEAIAPTYHRHHGKRRKPMRSGERTSSVLDAEAKSTSPTSVQSMDDRCGTIGTPHRPRAQTRENRKLNIRSPSILDCQKCNIPMRH